MGHLFDDAEHAPGLTDRELVASMRDARSTAFEALFRRHAETVRAFIIATIANRSHTEDLLQETFVLAWRKLDIAKMRGDSVLPWLLATTQRLVANSNRSADTSTRNLAPLADLEQLAYDSTFEAALSVERAAALHDALAKLSTSDRQIVRLCLEEGLLYKEAARATRTSVSVVRNVLFRARQALRRELSAVAEGGHD